MNDLSFQDLYIGLNACFKVQLSKEKVDLFTDLSGDINPLHNSDEYARVKKMNGRVAHGLLTSSFYSTLVGVYLPGKRCLLQGIDVKFIKPVYEEDELEVYGEITYLNDTYKVGEIKAYIKNSSGKKISKATIRVGII